NVTWPSQSRPSQRSDSWIWSVACATSRLVSVFSIRSRNSPPSWRANSQLKSAVWTLPMCRKPVGLGAKRTRAATSVAYCRARAARFQVTVRYDGARRRRRLPRPLPDQPGEPERRDLRKVGRCAREHHGGRVRDRGRRRRLPRRLAPGGRLRGWAEAGGAGPAQGARALLGDDVAADRE